MKTKIFGLLAFAIILSCSAQLQAQLIKAISFSYMNESVAYPFTSYKEFHPGVELGASLWVKEGNRSVQQMNTYAGWFLHQHLENGLFLRGDYTYSYKLIDAISIDIHGGLGYLHTIYPGTLYELNQEDGSFSAADNWGRPRLLISAGIGITYHNSSQFEPFLKQDLAIETPFANGIPVMPHSFIKLGINYKL